jgi:hypothetical protein
MPGPLHDPRVSRVPIGWDQVGQGYRAPTLRLAADFEWELRVHDADGSAAIVAAIGGLGLAESHTEGADVVLAAGVLTAVTPWIDTQGWTEVLIHIENRGAQPVTYNESRWSERAAGTWPYRAGLLAAPVAGEGTTFTVPAVAAAAWASPGVKARYCQLQSISAAGTTVRCWTILRRNGGTGAS